MNAGSSKATSATSLELGKLRSYSPTWPYLVRLTLAMAVQYACMRYVERAEAIHQLLNPNGIDDKDDDEEEDDLVERDEDGNVKGRLEGWDRKSRIRKDGELVAAWKEYSDKFIIATCQHLGVPRETLPPGPTTLEDIRSASRGRPIDDSRRLRAPQYEMGTSYASALHEGTGLRGEEIVKGEKRADVGTPTDIERQDPRYLGAKEDAIGRKGGSLDDEEFKGRNIELVNELILISLGLGQYRGEDGSTTLFEQEAIFGDLDERANQQNLSSQEREKVKDDIATQEPRSASTTASEMGTRAWQAATSTFVKATKRDSKEIEHQKNEKSHAPTKPNEPCHYDARARAIIFVAITAMGVESVDVCMAEKVLAQTIYFILSEGRNESTRQGKGDPLQQQDGKDTSSRQEWMNQSSQSAVAKEKAKVNWGKYIATGAGVAVGGAIIGLTSGLAAPLIAPALGGLLGSAFLTSTAGFVMIGSLLGVTAGGLSGYKVQQRLRGIDHFEFREVNSTAREAGMSIPSLHATICCSGLLLKGDRQGAAFDEAFHHSIDSRDAFTIQAEEEKMREAGEGLKGYVIDTAIRTGGRKVGEEVIKHTALAGLAALALPLTIWGTASAALDGVFVQAKSRAYRAGLILADVLRDQVQGHRPVILIGTSLGCFTILTALGELAKAPEENMHIVDSVYLIGAPITPSPGTLRRARSITARRFVNVYTRDMVCSIAAWLGSGISLEELRSGLMPRVIGSQPVVGVPGIDNVDVSDLTKDGHFSLNRAETLANILKRCNAME